MRAWFQKTLSPQSPSVTAVLHNIRRLRKQHAWFPLTRHERIEERTSRVAAKQRELLLQLDLHTDRLPRRSAVEDVREYLRAPMNKRLIVYPVLAAIVLGWLMWSVKEITDINAPQNSIFNLSFRPPFLHDTLALEMAYQALSDSGYQVRKWNPVEPLEKPRRSKDVYLRRSTTDAGVIVFTNTAAGGELLVTVHLSDNTVSCYVEEPLPK